jgi:hypothetical protein
MPGIYDFFLSKFQRPASDVAVDVWGYVSKPDGANGATAAELGAIIADGATELSAEMRFGRIAVQLLDFERSGGWRNDQTVFVLSTGL